MIASVDPDADSLAQYLRAQLPKLKGGVRLQRIGSGQSNPTYSVTCANGPDLILRKQPPGPMLESAHAVAYAMQIASGMPKDAILLVNLSGRGDKDMHTVAERSGIKF